ncbi:MAG: hypothetical protein ACREF6_06090 [Alphaproteobacteria bacterium]
MLRPSFADRPAIHAPADFAGVRALLTPPVESPTVISTEIGFEIVRTNCPSDNNKFGEASGEKSKFNGDIPMG